MKGLTKKAGRFEPVLTNLCEVGLLALTRWRENPLSLNLTLPPRVFRYSLVHSKKFFFESAKPTTDISPALQCWGQRQKGTESVKQTAEIMVGKFSVVRFADSIENTAMGTQH